jgi:hypothetical protein
MSTFERDNDGVDLESYDGPAYKGRGQAGDEVADALTRDLVEEYASDDLAAEFAPHRGR